MFELKEADGWQAPKVGLRRALEIHFVVEFRDCLPRRIAAFKLQLADMTVDCFLRDDRKQSRNKNCERSCGSERRGFDASDHVVLPIRRVSQDCSSRRTRQLKRA